MDWLIALAHIVGAAIAVFGLSFLAVLLAAWETERVRQREMEQTAIKLSVAPNQLGNEELAPRLVQLASERFSDDLLTNRISDLCGIIRRGWGWLGLLLQIGTFIGVIWYTITEGSNNAVVAWFVVAIALFFWFCSVVFSFLCRLLTGRYPGQAKEARKLLAAFIRQNADVNA